MGLPRRRSQAIVQELARIRTPRPCLWGSSEHQHHWGRHHTQCRYGISASSLLVPGGAAWIEPTIPVSTYMEGASHGGICLGSLIGPLWDVGVSSSTCEVFGSKMTTMSLSVCWIRPMVSPVRPSGSVTLPRD